VRGEGPQLKPVHVMNLSSFAQLWLLASSAATHSEATTSGADGEKSTFMYLTCISNLDCSGGNGCLEVLTETVAALKGTDQCPSQSICVCGEELEETALGSTITGEIIISVSKPANFIKDSKAKLAMTKAVANLAGVPVDYVNVTLTLQEGTADRRLEEQHNDTFRRLQDTASVMVSYTIVIPADEPDGVQSTVEKVQKKLSAASADTEAATGVFMKVVEAEAIGDSYTLTVVQVSESSTRSGVQLPTTTPAAWVDSVPAQASLSGRTMIAISVGFIIVSVL